MVKVNAGLEAVEMGVTVTFKGRREAAEEEVGVKVKLATCLF